MKETEEGKYIMPHIHMGSGEALVLIHGLGEIKEGWTRQFELASQFELIIPDLRGHGENKTYEGISVENFARDVLTLLKELQIESAHICGLSMGGVVAQEIYRQAPEVCRSLILVNTLHYFPKWLESSIFFHIRKARALFLTPEQQKVMAAKTCLYSWREENLQEFYKLYKPDKKGYLLAMKACLEVDHRDILPHIKIPTLIIGSQYDAITPVGIQIMMHEMIPNSELVIFKKSGHISKFEAAKEFNSTVRHFIDKHKIRNKAG
ncbi:alpha/beta fold hydrolase [Bacillus dakarensis]|uniref:alpha/beta fold hydrolase n=1 Tax=Robertmurraya dakarensis TaxID=1926278 RepID=UPI000980A9D6|nr:alpha/beta hydrolase [Bacillus dakarensis]